MTSVLTNHAPAAPINVLLVDDDHAAARQMAECLTKAGLRCTTFSNPWQALRSLAGEDSPQVAVVDVCMPELSGLQFVEKLCVTRGADRPEVILVSGNASLDHALEAMRFGVRRFLRKPLDLPELIREVKTAGIQQELRMRPPTHNVPQAEARHASINVQRLIAHSKWRERFFPKQLLSDHCWRMLLELYEAHATSRKVSLTSVALVSSLPLATAMRHLHTMKRLSLVEYNEDPQDKRRTFVRISATAIDQMKKFLTQIEEIDADKDLES